MESFVEIMARRLFGAQNVTLGLSVFLFIFMFLPTFVILLAVVVFFGLVYPRLRQSPEDREQGMESRQSDIKKTGAWYVVENALFQWIKWLIVIQMSSKGHSHNAVHGKCTEAFF